MVQGEVARRGREQGHGVAREGARYGMEKAGAGAQGRSGATDVSA